MSGSQFLRFGGATSCYILRAEKHALVLDCGTGLYDAAPYLAGCAEIDVLLTHLHYDHILGLLDSSAIPSEARVRVYISGTYASNIQKLMDFLRAPFWPISKHIGEITFVDCGQVLRLTERVSVRFFRRTIPMTRPLSVWIPITALSALYATGNMIPQTLMLILL